VAAVTAGPGVTNAVTALQNARMAQSPLLLLGGATATVLKGRGALQDIDQISLMAPLVKWVSTVRRTRELPEKLVEALYVAQEGVPGPVFLECPVDLLYDEEVVRGWYEARSKPSGSGAKPKKASLGEQAQAAYLKWHTRWMFSGSNDLKAPAIPSREPALPAGGDVHRTAERLARAERPLLLVGSQALTEAGEA